MFPEYYCRIHKIDKTNASLVRRARGTVGDCHRYKVVPATQFPLHSLWEQYNSVYTPRFSTIMFGPIGYKSTFCIYVYLCVCVQNLFRQHSDASNRPQFFFESGLERMYLVENMTCKGTKEDNNRPARPRKKSFHRNQFTVETETESTSFTAKN